MQILFSVALSLTHTLTRSLCACKQAQTEQAFQSDTLLCAFRIEHDISKNSLHMASLCVFNVSGADMGKWDFEYLVMYG
jgi:hypothetical protein